MTEQTLLDAVRAATARSTGGEGFRVADITGICPHVVRRGIAAGIKNGTIALTSQRIMQINGVVKTVPAYKLVEKKKR